MPRRHTLPSINEDSEKNYEKIQDIKKALRIDKDDTREPLRVRSAQNADSVDKDPPAPTKRGKAPLLRTTSEKTLDPWNRKRQGPGFVNGNQRARTGVLNNRQKLFGFGQRKITSPRIDNGKQKLALNDVPDTIDLTKHEDVQAILQRFYVKDLKMDSSDPRLSGSDDFIDSLRSKAQRRFSIGELWHSNAPGQSLLNRRKSKNLTNQLSPTMDGKRVTAHLRKHQAEHSPGKILSQTLESFKHKPTFEVSYARPMTLNSLQTTVPGTRKVLTSSFQEQPNDVNKYSSFHGQSKTASKRRRAKFLRPIKPKREPPGITLLNNRTDI